MTIRKMFFLVVSLILITSTAMTTRTHAEAVILTAAVPANIKDGFGEQIVQAFNDTYPGMSLSLVRAVESIPPATTQLDQHFGAVEEYTRKADVLWIDFAKISPEATQAGYFLDLAPLIADNKTLNPEDYWPAVWQSYQWDNATWALPINANAIVMGYDPTAFDTAGLTYPQESWTVEDLANAARKLTAHNTDGSVKVAGFNLFSSSAYPIAEAALLRSLIGTSLVDTSTTPSTPHFAIPAAEKVLDTLAEMERDGVMNIGSKKAPVTLPSFEFSSNSFTATLLPGGQSVLQVNGLAVSAGTQHPEQAYLLAKFLSTRPELILTTGLIPALKDYDRAKGMSAPHMYSQSLSDQAIKLNGQAVQSAIPYAEVRYGNYLILAREKMKAEHLDAHAALQLIELQALDAQKKALTKKTTTQAKLFVATPLPTLVVKPGETILKFGIKSYYTSLLNAESWERLAYDFSTSDSQVKKVELQMMPMFPDPNFSFDQYDCFYLPYNEVPGAWPDSLLSLNPLLEADSTFDRSDFVKGTLDQVTSNHQIYGLPVVMEPLILQYYPERFKKANVPLPEQGWTMTGFLGAIKALKDDSPVLAGYSSGVPLLMLMAANGALPVDYRTSPPTLNFTDPAYIDAIQQILSLAREHSIYYEPLSYPQMGGESVDPPIFAFTLSTYRLNNSALETFQWTTFPTGQFNAVAYSLGVLYISAKTSYPDGCYRWLKAVSARPELFSTMPTRRSLFDSSTHDKTASALYREFDGLLNNPQTVVFPLSDNGTTGLLILSQMPQRLLYAAFDHVVLDGKELKAELEAADDRLTTYEACRAKIPEHDNTRTSINAYIKSLTACATQVDPNIWHYLPRLPN